MILILIFLILFLRSGFSWTDGKPLAFVNWYTNEPYPLNRHLCAGFNSGGKWQDEPCYLKFPSICKRPLGKRHFIYFFIASHLAVFKASLQWPLRILYGEQIFILLHVLKIYLNSSQISRWGFSNLVSRQL